MFLLMLAAQAGTLPAPPPVEAEPIAPIDFDLRQVAPAPTANEIIVTGHRREDRGLQPLTAFSQEQGLPRAETSIGGNLRAGIVAEQKTLGGGVISNRAMVKLKIPF